MNNRDFQIISKILKEIEIIEDLIMGKSLEMGDVWVTIVNDIPKLKGRLIDIVKNV